MSRESLITTHELEKLKKKASRYQTSCQALHNEVDELKEAAKKLHEEKEKKNEDHLKQLKQKEEEYANQTQMLHDEKKKYDVLQGRLTELNEEREKEKEDYLKQLKQKEEEYAKQTQMMHDEIKKCDVLQGRLTELNEEKEKEKEDYLKQLKQKEEEYAKQTEMITELNEEKVKEYEEYLKQLKLKDEENEKQTQMLTELNEEKEKEKEDYLKQLKQKEEEYAKQTEMITELNEEKVKEYEEYLKQLNLKDEENEKQTQMLTELNEEKEKEKEDYLKQLKQKEEEYAKQTEMITELNEEKVKENEEYLKQLKLKDEEHAKQMQMMTELNEEKVKENEEYLKQLKLKDEELLKQTQMLTELNGDLEGCKDLIAGLEKTKSELSNSCQEKDLDNDKLRCLVSEQDSRIVTIQQEKKKEQEDYLKHLKQKDEEHATQTQILHDEFYEDIQGRQTELHGEIIVTAMQLKILKKNSSRYQNSCERLHKEVDELKEAVKKVQGEKEKENEVYLKQLKQKDEEHAKQTQILHDDLQGGLTDLKGDLERCKDLITVLEKTKSELTNSCKEKDLNYDNLRCLVSEQDSTIATIQLKKNEGYLKQLKLKDEEHAKQLQMLTELNEEKEKENEDYLMHLKQKDEKYAKQTQILCDEIQKNDVLQERLTELNGESLITANELRILKIKASCDETLCKRLHEGVDELKEAVRKLQEEKEKANEDYLMQLKQKDEEHAKQTQIMHDDLQGRLTHLNGDLQRCKDLITGLEKTKSELTNSCKEKDVDNNNLRCLVSEQVSTIATLQQEKVKENEDYLKLLKLKDEEHAKQTQMLTELNEEKEMEREDYLKQLQQKNEELAKQTQTLHDDLQGRLTKLNEEKEKEKEVYLKELKEKDEEYAKRTQMLLAEIKRNDELKRRLTELNGEKEMEKEDYMKQLKQEEEEHGKQTQMLHDEIKQYGDLQGRLTELNVDLERCSDQIAGLEKTKSELTNSCKEKDLDNDKLRCLVSEKDSWIETIQQENTKMKNSVEDHQFKVVEYKNICRDWERKDQVNLEQISKLETQVTHLKAEIYDKENSTKDISLTFHTYENALKDKDEEGRTQKEMIKERDITIDDLKHQVQELNARTTELNNHIVEQREQVDSLRHAVDERVHELNQERSLATEYYAKLNSSVETIQDLSVQLACRYNENVELQQTVFSHEALRLEYETEQYRLSSELQAVEQNKADLDLENKMIKDELNKWKTGHSYLQVWKEKHEQLLEKNDNELRDLQRTLQEERNIIAQLDSKTKSLTADLSSCQDQNASLCNTISELRESCAENEMKINELDSITEEREATITTQQNQYAAITAGHIQLITAHERLSTDYTAYTQHVREMEEQLKLAREELNKDKEAYKFCVHFQQRMHASRLNRANEMDTSFRERQPGEDYIELLQRENIELKDDLATVTLESGNLKISNRKSHDQNRHLKTQLDGYKGRVFEMQKQQARTNLLNGD